MGIINTAFGYSIMFGLTFMEALPEIANTISYLLAFMLSYILNKTFTFRANHANTGSFIRFAIVTTIAYIINLILLVICHRILLWNKYIALIIASIAYVIVSYILHRIWTFKDYKPKS